MNFILLLKNTIGVSLEIFELLMLARALLNLLAPDSENPLVSFVFTVTEAGISPVRAICDRKKWFQHTPLDMPFFITVILVWGMQLLIELIG